MSRELLLLERLSELACLSQKRVTESGIAQFRCGMFASAAPLASTFAGALAYGITSGHSSLSNWRLLFLVEGLPTILLAPVAFFFIPDSPDEARFLNVEEKAIAKARAIRQTGTSERIGNVNLKQIAQTLFDVKAWCYAVRINVSRTKISVISSHNQK